MAKCFYNYFNFHSFLYEIILRSSAYSFGHSDPDLRSVRSVPYIFYYLYSHLSNKREVTLTDFEKFHPPQKNPPSKFIDFLDFFHPPLYVYCSFFQKIPTSTFSDFATFAPSPRLFQPPRLLER